MPKTYYDSELTAKQIEDALTAIDGVVIPGNNGKVLYIDDGKIKAASASRWSGGAVLEPLSATANGDYYPPSGTDGFGEVHVAVPGGGGGGVEHLTPPLIGAEIKNIVGVGITTNDPTENGSSIIGYEFSSGYEGMNVVIRDLTIGQNYTVSFDFQSTDAAFFSGQYTLGYKISSSAVPSYPTSPTPDPSYTAFTRDLTVNPCEAQFTATANEMYLIFAFVGYSDSRTNYFSISNLRVNDVNA